MPLLIQLCVVVVSIALAVVAVATVRALHRLVDTASRWARVADAAAAAVAQSDRTGREAELLLVSLRETVTPIQGVARRFGTLGERAASLSDAVLDEVESPLLTAVAVSRGVKVGASVLAERLIQRFSRSESSTNGDAPHELDRTARP